MQKNEVSALSRSHFSTIFLLSITLILPSSAYAQLSNKPFSFGSVTKGVGMSTAGKQAIINRKLFGSTPNVLLKSPDGRLLGVSKGPGPNAIVTSPSGEIIPGYRGRRSFVSWGAGIHNPYFAGIGSGDTLTGLAGSSGSTIDSWTGQVISGVSANYGSGNSVDQWTDMVYW
jgi:hypothetical protein